ncbi:MAG: ABC transporter ATP-binding protein [Thermoanaerobaculaceae bacterium]
MLEVEGLYKKYGGWPAVSGVSFVVRPGEILGYLGPNGAGKSTTVKVLAGLLEPSWGALRYGGRDILAHREWFKQRLGYVPENAELYPFLSGREYLEMVGRLRDLPEPVIAARVAGFLDLLGLQADAHAPIGTYSKGMRQKVLLAAALLHDPEVLLLDEPLSGLDASTAAVVKELLHRLAADGRVVLFSSHVLEVVERLATRVVILHRGRVVADDSVAALRDLRHAPSLEEVFIDLVSDHDTARTAAGLREVMRCA